jgi:hypothetical protein
MTARLRAISFGLGILGLTGCGGFANSTPSPLPSVAVPAPNPDHDFATAACADTDYGDCLKGMRLMMETAPGSTVAVCDHGDGQGDIVIIDTRAEAEAACSGDGTITPSRVVRIVQVPRS